MALNAVSERSSTALVGDGPRYSASVPVYPECLFWDVDSTSPTLVLAGELDDWTPAPSCAKKVAKRKAEGYPVDIRIYPNAHHAWDNPSVGHYFGPQFRNMNSRSGSGATVAYNAQARAASEQDALAFLDLHLKQVQVPASTTAWVRKAVPTRDTARALLERAVAFYQTHGKDKLVEVVKDIGGPFRERQLYIDVGTPGGENLAWGLMPQRSGRQWMSSEFQAKEKEVRDKEVWGEQAGILGNWNMLARTVDGLVLRVFFLATPVIGF